VLGWNKKKSDHPMADEKGAKELLAELPTSDPFKTLQEVAHWLEAARDAEALKPQRIFEIIDQLDATGRLHARKLSQEYLAAGNRLQRFQEQRIYSSVVEFWRQLGAGYEFCLAQGHPSVPGASAIKPLAPMITARAIRALTLELKWGLMRYAPADPTLWGRLGALYAQAEKAGFNSKACAMYPGVGAPTSVESEYLAVLMLGMSATDSLLPRKLEVAERIVSNFAQYFVLQKQLAKGCHYHVDLAVARPPARLMARVGSVPTVRYFGPGAACDMAEKAIGAITDRGAVPSDLSLGDNYEPALVVEVLRHLARYWAPVPPSRNEERRRSFARINIVHDFDEIIAIIAGGRKDETDLSFDQHIETWTVENESENGYGAIIPPSKADWLKVGTLLGIKLEDGNAWGVGIVRRLSNDPTQQRYVGIQTLAKGGTRVKLFAVGGGHSSEDAVLLPSSAEDSRGTGELSLLMRMGTFSQRQNFQMRAYERNYMLIPKQLIEGGQDFDMAKFRVLQRSE